MADSALAEARAAFGDLRKDDFTELMAYKSPPEALALVCGTALLAVGMPAERGWADVQRGIIANPETFRRAVLALDPAQIDPRRRAGVSERLATLAGRDMLNVTNLGAALHVWLKAVVLPK